ncbi:MULTISPECIES: hypothetical protein [unclassified Cellulophaga]|uniref:hypothetical protein n=1 Tax=unclassified Cellulophaga TaxID=2634405 RepID=UPI0026E48518|nr:MULTISPECIES: hypothetical protein [unclassified Cellulophaga]MDO6491781.1 hypothetical protein [Cellulophaga sp. 2_MG-2023]MDO6495564.1 hypothetical protein [Cellulophaga sp. 3_MG-2023]
MDKLELIKYGEEFLSIGQYSAISGALFENYNNSNLVVLDAFGVSVIAPSIMTKIIDGLFDNGVKKVILINGSPKLTSTFNFAMFSVNKKRQVLVGV